MALGDFSVRLSCDITDVLLFFQVDDLMIHQPGAELAPLGEFSFF